MRLFAAVDGLRCGECADAVVRRLEAIEGVRWARSHLATSTLAVDFGSEPEGRARLVSALESRGATLLGAYPTRAAAERAGVAWLEAQEKAALLKTGAALFLALLIWAGGRIGLSPYSLGCLSAVVLFACGRPALAGMGHAWLHRRADSASLIGLASSAAFAHTVVAAFRPEALLRAELLSGWLSALLAASLGAWWLEARRRRLAGQAAERFVRSLPSTARVVSRDGREARRPVGELRSGDLVAILPGELIPVDGPVIEGRSSVDESFILGEGLSVEKSPGSNVLAGAHNRGGRLVVRADRWGEACLLGTLIESIRDAQSARADPLDPSDQVSAAAFPAVVLLACGVGAWWLYLDQAPAALSAALEFAALAVPPGLLFAGPLARLAAPDDGVCALADGAAERARDIEILVLGKSGLLAGSKPRVSAVRAGEGVAAEEVLGLALVGASAPEHPYADAVRRYAAERGVSAPEGRTGLDYFPGRGVRAVVGEEEVWIGSPDWLKTRGIDPRSDWSSASLWVARGRKLVGALEFSNGLRPKAAEAVAELKRRGLEVVLASGDTEPRVRAAADSLGLQSFHWGVAPVDEVALVAALQSRGKRVAAVGRGLIEAPVLAQADLGLSASEGLPADVRLEQGSASATAAAMRRAEGVRLACRVNLLAFWLPQAAAALWAAWGRAPTLAAVAAAAAGLSGALIATIAVRRLECSRVGG